MMRRTSVGVAVAIGLGCASTEPQAGVLYGDVSCALGPSEADAQSASADTGTAGPGADVAPDAGPALTPALPKVQRFEGSGCPSGTVRLADFCIDRYEASVWDSVLCDGKGQSFGSAKGGPDFPATWPANGQYSNPDHALFACSLPGVLPAGWVTWFQAAAACVESGKRLCTNAEWQVAAMGTPDTVGSCPTAIKEAETVLTSAFEKTCASRWGVVNLFGNVQELTADWVISGGPAFTAEEQLKAGAAGVVAALPEFLGSDDTTTSVGGHAWVGVSPTYAMAKGVPAMVQRGGSYGAGTASGPFNYNVTASPFLGYYSGGFRCCVDAWTHPDVMPPPYVDPVEPK